MNCGTNKKLTETLVGPDLKQSNSESGHNNFALIVLCQEFSYIPFVASSGLDTASNKGKNL